VIDVKNSSGENVVKYFMMTTDFIVVML